jgi:hypothetical protein
MKTPLLDAAMRVIPGSNIPPPNELDESLKHYYNDRGMDSSDLLWEAISSGENADEKHIKYLLSNLFINGNFMLREHSQRLLNSYHKDISEDLYFELESIITNSAPTIIDSEFCIFAKIFLDSYNA